MESDMLDVLTAKQQKEFDAEEACRREVQECRDEELDLEAQADSTAYWEEFRIDSLWEAWMHQLGW